MLPPPLRHTTQTKALSQNLSDKFTVVVICIQTRIKFKSQLEWHWGEAKLIKWSLCSSVCVCVRTDKFHCCNKQSVQWLNWKKIKTKKTRQRANMNFVMPPALTLLQCASNVPREMIEILSFTLSDHDTIVFDSGKTLTHHKLICWFFGFGLCDYNETQNWVCVWHLEQFPGRQIFFSFCFMNNFDLFHQRVVTSHMFFIWLDCASVSL